MSVHTEKPPDDPLLSLRQHFPALAHPLTYFNSAYTTLVPVPVLDAAREAALSRWARRPEQLEAIRARVAAFLGARPEDLTFIPGTTQGLALVAGRLRLSPYDRVVASVAEHRANREPWGRSRVELARVEPNGCVRWRELEARLPGAAVLALAHVGNVTGEIAPVAELAAAASEAGALVVLDAAQSAPHLPLAVDALGVDALVFSGHKAWGLSGVGVLWTRPELADRMGLDRLAVEDALPWEAIAALPSALELLAASRTPALEAHRRQLVERLTAGLRALPGAVVLGPDAPGARIPLFAIGGAGRSVAAIADRLRDRGVITRAGMHHTEPLHASVGLDGTLRISAHTYNTLDEADRLLEALREAWGD